jgi:hypothetical protein
MRKFTVPFSMFLAGIVIGCIVAPNVLRWIVSAFGGQISYTNLTGSFASRLQFGVGCGVLFAAAAIVGRSFLWIAIYLIAGITVSTVVAVLTRSSYAWYGKEAESLGLNVVISMHSLPTLRIPLIGAVAIPLPALLRWLPSRRNLPSSAPE